jgi:CheY-like chemotaxis protein
MTAQQQLDLLSGDAQAMIKISPKVGCNFGVGGYAMKLACQRMGATLNLKSFVDIGTEIGFSFDITAQDIDSCSQPAAVCSSPRSLVSQVVCKVLLVDDDLLALKIHETMFKCEGGQYIVTTAASAEEGLQALLANDIDIVFSDYHMGEESGLDMYRMYQKQQQGKAPRMFLLTGGIDAETMQKAVELGVPVLTKPVSFQEMIHECRSLRGRS